MEQHQTLSHSVLYAPNFQPYSSTCLYLPPTDAKYKFIPIKHEASAAPWAVYSVDLLDASSPPVYNELKDDLQAFTLVGLTDSFLLIELLCHEKWMLHS